MLMSLESLLAPAWLTSWLKVMLPALIVMIGFGLPGHNFPEAPSAQPANSAQHHTQHHTLLTASPTAPHQQLPASERQPESGKPLFFLSLLSEDAEEDTELALKGILALLGLALLHWVALTLKRLPAQAPMPQAAFSPFAGLGPSPLFLLLQNFRL